MENKLVPMGENTYRISLKNIKLDCYEENSLKTLKKSWVGVAILWNSSKKYTDIFPLIKNQYKIGVKQIFNWNICIAKKIFKIFGKWLTII